MLEPRAALLCLLVSAGSFYIITMMIWSYYMACKVPPGTTLEGLSGVYHERRYGPGSGYWWREKREQVAHAAYRHSGVSDEYESNDAETSLPLVHPHDFTPHYSIHERIKARLKTSPPPPPVGMDLTVHFRFCKKCKTIPLTEAVLCLPPELRQSEKYNRRSQLLCAQRDIAATPELAYNEAQLYPDIAPELFNDADDEGEKEVRAWLGNDADNAVLAPKPERAHHCNTCNACILKYDHHCPWINQCVGLGNERYFILFMLWFSVGAGFMGIAGWPIARAAVSRKIAWDFAYAPRLVFLLIYVKAAVMSVVVFILASWHVWLVAHGQTSVESQDNAQYRKIAKERNETFANVYDLGRIRNLQLFFNVGPGMMYKYYTLFLPMHVRPYSDGWHWAKHAGMHGRHTGIKVEEEFTDDEDA
ncbi:protein S-acyltransferase [Malassezia vespertilionis]|uniref:Palmitoyltransferase n=1 Tax=Malassezia vespertilionis TaxID=2020962 RepID=A0A2N1JAH7_9BASI|nr:protein S-acyltransferase [Malassezia vespertilionis]PKI83554.1 hypothetical protein MVES_002471 [Malassezia vespertilionis]WFD07257.1 protein S-acyltransferase [Malassezia vespertilionis]